MAFFWIVSCLADISPSSSVDPLPYSSEPRDARSGRILHGRRKREKPTKTGERAVVGRTNATGPCRIRTCDQSNMSRLSESHNPLENNGLTESGKPGLPECLPDSQQNDPVLAAIIEAWGGLPDAIRAGIVAMVRAMRA